MVNAGQHHVPCAIQGVGKECSDKTQRQEDRGALLAGKTLIRDDLLLMGSIQSEELEKASQGGGCEHSLGAADALLPG